MFYRLVHGYRLIENNIWLTVVAQATRRIGCDPDFPNLLKVHLLKCTTWSSLARVLLLVRLLRHRIRKPAKMLWNTLLTLALVAPSSGLVRFHCSQLVTERLDPLVNPGMVPSTHVHQIVGGVRNLQNLFSLLTNGNRIPSTLACTQRKTCLESLLARHANSQKTCKHDPNAHSYRDISSNCNVAISSNYWTAVLYFRAKNGTYKRVPQLGNNQFRTAKGGLTVYYMQDAIYDPNQKSKVTAFQPVSQVPLRNTTIPWSDSENRDSECL
jgi:hypothetical protein